jgi:F0F1-type ATP synthase assembly protein I
VKTRTEDPARNLERRLLLVGACLLLLGGATILTIWDLNRTLSFVGGGLLGGLSLTWLRKGLGAIFSEDRKTAKRRVLAGFLLRLLLIPLCLYAMIRFLFLSVPAAVAGFAVLHFSVFIEGIREAFSNSSKKHA